jgi:hypothetical protein
LTPSEQVAPWHVPPVQTPLAQSDATAQALFASHVEQTPPPQSTSDSAPFFCPSVQLDAPHWPALQAALSQSELFVHAAPLAHGAHAPPPQSTSVSFPSFTPS